jgi:hypothetical protein
LLIESLNLRKLGLEVDFWVNFVIFVGFFEFIIFILNYVLIFLMRSALGCIQNTPLLDQKSPFFCLYKLEDFLGSFKLSLYTETWTA